MYQPSIDQNIIQSTTVKTIKELKKLGDSRINLEAEENKINDSTLSGKNSPGGETSKTQHTKITIIKKPTFKSNAQTQNRIVSMKQTINKPTEEATEQSNVFRRASLRQGSIKPLKPNTQLQLEGSDPVDLSNALNLVLTKCKNLRDQFEELQLTNTLINKFIKNDKQFHFTFQAFLDDLVGKGKLLQNLTNIQKPILQKIEQFTINHVKRCIQKSQINQQYEEKTKHVDTLFNRYYKELASFGQNVKYF
ncbi:unnamed protein product (macronuclear) [Paramecium tetraurelia]|uniref:Uncharacterized protein n=1 Tax=Paramecium tetraurelia TaxID=5888 RepID=A0DTT9_PARTE|nr:uncharacterized protein GSPATT00020138001 [Paramecium tetraurelia]CAK86456.1 unnamed protein product [Paramecium tetraurelia]|eukprot:XP_001453853.1 hypothetical protein (macronuclear) [Paramecium tetraurelia strain d4-2]